MPKVRFGDVVREVKHNIDRNNNPYESYVAGDHMDTADLTIHRRGCFATDDVGPAFVREFKKGQVLYGSRRTYLKKVAVADFDGVTANTTFVLETKNPDIFLQTLLPFVMLTDSFTEWSVKRSKGSTNPYVLFSDLADFEFELPDIEEQRRVSDVLWACFRLREHYEGLIQQCDALVQSQFVEMFGDPILTEKDETLTALSDSCILKAGKFIKADDISDTRQDGQYPCFGGNGIRGYVSQFNQEGERPLIGRQGALCGNVQYATGRFYATEHAVVVTPKGNDINTLWLYYLLQHLKLERYATGAAQPGIAVNKLEQIRVSIPGIMAQTRFSRFARETDKSKYDGKVSLENAWIGGDMCA